MGFWTYGRDSDWHWNESDRNIQDCICPYDEGPQQECYQHGDLNLLANELGCMGGFTRVGFRDGPLKDKIEWIDLRPTSPRVVMPDYIKYPISGYLTKKELSAFTSIHTEKGDLTAPLAQYLEVAYNPLIVEVTWFEGPISDTIQWEGYYCYSPDYSYEAIHEVHYYKLARRAKANAHEFHDFTTDRSTPASPFSSSP